MTRRVQDKKMFSARRTYLRQWFFAALVGALAVIARAIAQPTLGDASPFMLAFPAVVLVALLWGTAPALAAGAVCALGVWLPGIPPTIPEGQRLAQFGWFGLSAIGTAVLCGRLRGQQPFQARPDLDRPHETPLSAWLQAVLWGALFLPLSVFVAASWWSLERAEADSATSLSHASDLALRHAERAFSVAQAIAWRAEEASRGTAADTRAREATIHQRLADMAAGLTAVVNANVWDANGSIVARSDRFPVNPAFTIADRGYFQRLRAPGTTVAVSEVMIGRQSGKPVMNVAVRRGPADGAFNGIVTVTLAPAYFSEYYQSLAREEAMLATFALVRSDGAVLARWPGETGRAYLADGSDLRALLARGAASGELTTRTDDGIGRQRVRFRRVADLPVYVVTGVSRSAMLGAWARYVAVLALVVLPVTGGLVYVSWIALRKTRREAAIAAQLHEHVQTRAEMQRRMLEAQRLETLSFVTGSVAHDFNNLLAVITSSLHVHKIQRPDVAGDRPLAAISRSVQNGVRLTRQLLSFSKKQALRPEVIDFQTWLPAVDALMRSTLGSTARWRYSVDADTRAVKVDPAELELALINLTLNAKLAMPKGGDLTVHVSNDESAAAHAPSVIVCVIDTGSGIAPDVLPRVFEPFFTTRERGVGSGLGLTQVQAFCVQSGGRVTIESQVGHGTMLCMHLPATPEAASRPQESLPPMQETSLDGSLLLVEDNEDVGRSTEQLLRSAGLKVVRVLSADAALDHLETAGADVDIVLTDVAMPGSMNGIGLALELRRRRPGLPVVLHTGYAEQIELGTAQGLRVFQKPVLPAVMLAELGALLASQKGSTNPP